MRTSFMDNGKREFDILFDMIFPGVYSIEYASLMMHHNIFSSKVTSQIDTDKESKNRTGKDSERDKSSATKVVDKKRKREKSPATMVEMSEEEQQYRRGVAKIERIIEILAFSHKSYLSPSVLYNNVIIKSTHTQACSPWNVYYLLSKLAIKSYANEALTLIETDNKFIVKDLQSAFNKGDESYFTKLLHENEGECDFSKLLKVCGYYHGYTNLLRDPFRRGDDDDGRRLYDLYIVRTHGFRNSYFWTAEYENNLHRIAGKLVCLKELIESGDYSKQDRIAINQIFKELCTDLNQDILEVHLDCHKKQLLLSLLLDEAPLKEYVQEPISLDSPYGPLLCSNEIEYKHIVAHLKEAGEKPKKKGAKYSGKDRSALSVEMVALKKANFLPKQAFNRNIPINYADEIIDWLNDVIDAGYVSKKDRDDFVESVRRKENDYDTSKNEEKEVSAIGQELDFFENMK